MGSVGAGDNEAIFTDHIMRSLFGGKLFSRQRASIRKATSQEEKGVKHAAESNQLLGSDFRGYLLVNSYTSSSMEE